MRPIITREQIGELARPSFADDATQDACLREAELIDMQRVLGPSLYARVKDEDTTPDPLLMDGGVYESKHCGKKMLAGIKTALAYFAYSRIISSSAISTRKGYIEKEDSRSNLAEYKRQVDDAQKAMDIGDRFMNECLDYIHESDAYDEIEAEVSNVVDNSSIHIKVIGR